MSISNDANAYRINENVTKTRKNVTNAPLSRFLVNVKRPQDPVVKPNAQRVDKTS